MKRVLDWFRRTPASEPHLLLNLNEPRSWVGRYPDVPPPETKLSLQMFAARFVCGDIYGEDTPAMAADLLEAGYDTPLLRRLAGETQIRCSADAAEPMEKIMREAGLPVPFPIRQARMIVTRQIARLVIAGERDPWRAVVDVKLVWGRRPDDEDVRGIVNCADDFEWDHQQQRYRPVVDADLLDRFAHLATRTDEEIIG